MASAPVAIQDLYPDDFAHCFGCGKHNARGHQLKSFVDGDDVVARFTPRSEHTSLPGFVYGGLVASLIDCHAMATAAAAAERAAGRGIGDGPAPRFVTAALNVSFLKPTPMGGELVLRARVTERSERKAIVEVTLSANDVVTARGNVVAVPMPASMSAAGPLV
ncbi:MAG: PaaI family thioesterase [Candidatus Latescibacteria bacterium]|nr:PaaI family thioesterase [Candidatus Latescibacterota bacterium]